MSAIQFLAEWAVRSSVLILAGAVVLMLLRVKDSSIRLAAWVALVCGSSIMPAIPLVTPSLPPVRVNAVPRIVESVVFFESLPLDGAALPKAVAKPQTSFDWARVGLIVYFVIGLALLSRVVVGLAMSWRLLRGSCESGLPGVRESDRVAAPVTLGIFRPVILLPVNWTAWDEAKLAAVLAHERSHIARFDPAVQVVSAVHRAVLWFSPASWFLHSRIVRVAEELSDDAAVAETRDRESYAEFLLEFMQCEECGAGVPMARYGAPEKRIYRILDGKSLSRGVTRWSAAAIVMLGVPLAYLAASVRSEQLPARAVAVVRESIPETLPLIPQIIAQVQAPRLPKPPAPAAPAAVRPKFDVASIKPCNPDVLPPSGRSGGGRLTGRYRLDCQTVMTMIGRAYVRFADGKNRSPMVTSLTKIEGGPPWIDSDLYTIEAEAEGTFTPMMMDGPMMQSLLEDRFQLKVHRETREGPVCELTVAKGGSRVQASKETPCVAGDLATIGMRLPPGDDRPCKLIFNRRKGPDMVMMTRGISMEEVAEGLTGSMGRLVIDKTGITGNVDLDLVYAPGEGTAGPAVTPSADGVPVAEDPVGPSIFTALERVGLKLESAKGPREYLVIDSVSRPSEN